MHDPSLANQRVRVGGPEVLTFRQLAAMIGRVLGREVGAGRVMDGRRMQCVEPTRWKPPGCGLSAMLGLRQADQRYMTGTAALVQSLPSVITLATHLQVPCTALPVLPAKAVVAALRAAARASQNRSLLGLYRFLYFVLLVSLDETVRVLGCGSCALLVQEKGQMCRCWRRGGPGSNGCLRPHLDAAHPLPPVPPRCRSSPWWGSRGVVTRWRTI